VSRVWSFRLVISATTGALIWATGGGPWVGLEVAVVLVAISYGIDVWEARNSALSPGVRRGIVSLAWILVPGVLALTLVSAATAGSPTSAGKSRTCFGKHPTILGTQHRDSIRGTSGRDVIISFGGNDGIRSRQGKDYVCAGSGDDVIHGAEGVNYMNGGPGDDWLDGRRGPGNVSIGSRGKDLIQAEGRIQGGPGNDTIESYGYENPGLSPVPDATGGGSGKDKIYGCGGNRAPQLGPRPSRSSWAWPHCYTGGGGHAELLKGGADSDKVFGGGGNDHLQGNGGNDRLYGEDGDDDINGGAGTNVCDQGPGTGSLAGCP
jgi:Ca2+-binding RTX toxin-like protein